MDTSSGDISEIKFSRPILDLSKTAQRRVIGCLLALLSPSIGMSSVAGAIRLGGLICGVDTSGGFTFAMGFIGAMVVTLTAVDILTKYMWEDRSWND